MLYATEEDVQRSIEVVRAELSQSGIIVVPEILRRITEDIMDISYSIGGDYSEKIISSITRTYVSKGFFKKFLADQQ